MIKVYSKSNCPNCNILINKLTQAGIEHEVIKIDEDDNSRQFLLGQGHRSVPQVYDDNNEYIGDYKTCLQKLQLN